MIEQYLPLDRYQDDIPEKFMHQGIQKMNDPEWLIVERSILSAIKLIILFPAAFARKRTDNNSDDSGVNSPEVFSPTVPASPDFSSTVSNSIDFLQKFLCSLCQLNVSSNSAIQ